LKTVFISGASGGIGNAIARKFLQEGYFVVAQYNSNYNGIKALMDYSESLGRGGYVFAVKADLRSSAQIEEMLSLVKKNFKYIDVVVNNAGAGLYKLITQTTDKEWDDLFAVNAKSAFLINNAFIGGMIDKKCGRIINVSSMWGNVGASMEVAYSASKASRIGYTKALAKELAPSGITVNCVCPGVIDTPMNSRFNESEILELIEQTPLGRLGTPEDVAQLVYYLSSNGASFITGQVISCDGGFTV